jgi:regulatory protein
LHRERGLARRAVAQKLRQRGIDDETIGAAVQQISGDGEHDAARALAQKRLRTMSGLAPDVQARRLVGFLARKGYAPGMAFEIVRDLIKHAQMEHSADSDGIAALADL